MERRVGDRREGEEEKVGEGEEKEKKKYSPISLPFQGFWKEDACAMRETLGELSCQPENINRVITVCVYIQLYPIHMGGDGSTENGRHHWCH